MADDWSDGVPERPTRQCHVQGETLDCDDYRWVENDARGIPLASVCDKCKEGKLSVYRQDVRENPNYWHDEPVEESI